MSRDVAGHARTTLQEPLIALFSNIMTLSRSLDSNATAWLQAADKARFMTAEPSSQLIALLAQRPVGQAVCLGWRRCHHNQPQAGQAVRGHVATAGARAGRIASASEGGMPGTAAMRGRPSEKSNRRLADGRLGTVA
jgi:hypothetical protein